MRYIITLLLGTLLLTASDTVTVSNLEWQDNQAAQTTNLNWQNAIAYCEDLELSGHSDWRLPTIRELQSIVDISRSHPAIKSVFSHTASTFSHTASSFYWSSSEDVSDAKLAWRVYFSNGSTYSYYKSDEYRVRCVRVRQ